MRKEKEEGRRKGERRKEEGKEKKRMRSKPKRRRAPVDSTQIGRLGFERGGAVTALQELLLLPLVGRTTWAALWLPETVQSDPRLRALFLAGLGLRGWAVVENFLLPLSLLAVHDERLGLQLKGQLPLFLTFL